MSSHNTSMSITSSTTRTNSTLKQRSADAIRSLLESLPLPAEMSDSAVLSTALAEVTAEEFRRNPNPRFALAVTQRYAELLASCSTSTRPRKQKESLPPLVPLERPEHEYAMRVHVDPFASPDPAAIIRVYGKAQLARALKDYMLDSLKQTAAAIEREHPGTKPTNRGRKEAVIEYIVRYSGT